MKKISFFACALSAMLIGFSACSEDDGKIDDGGQGQGGGNGSSVEEKGTHFDIWVSLGESTGMGSDGATCLVKSVDSLTVQEPINFKNDGVDVTATIYQESVIKDGYYYQVPKSADRFGKYRIADNRLETLAEHPFEQNTYKDRRYTHAWTDDNTLVIMAANGSADKVIWTKLNAADMSIMAEGELSLEVPEGDKFSTSGLAKYRESDNMIIYAFQHKNETEHFYVAFIDADDMSVVNEVMEDRADQMAGTAYGELLQDKMFFDEDDNLYIACNSKLPGAEKSTQQYGRLLRINNGETAFDKTYEGYNYDKGKIVTASYLTEGKALIYIQDPDYTGAGAWGDAYNCYYAVLDLKTDAKTEIQYQGQNLPFCSGTFSQRSLVDGDVAYIGVNPEDSEPCVYIYNIEDGTVEKGLSITEGYEFDRIVRMEENND